MNIGLIGINHRSSSIDIREKFFLRVHEREWLLSELRSDPGVAEALVLSTCNRTEVYLNVINAFDRFKVLKLLCRIKQVPYTAELHQYFYSIEGRRAVEHIFAVATGLDSLVLGEKQILGQVKKAVVFSERAGMLSKTFHVLTNLVIRAGKKARHETDIGYGGSSVSWAAVNMAQQILKDLHKKSALIIGAGKMGALALNQLRQAGVEKIYLMNRTFEKAQELAQENGCIPVRFWELKEVMAKVDLCICSVGAPHIIIEKAMVEAVERRVPRQLFIDISMPRNIDPAVKEIGGVELVAIDDLGEALRESQARRGAAVDAVQTIIAGKIAAFDRKTKKMMEFEERRLAQYIAPAGVV